MRRPGGVSEAGVAISMPMTGSLFSVSSLWPSLTSSRAPRKDGTGRTHRGHFLNTLIHFLTLRGILAVIFTLG